MWLDAKEACEFEWSQVEFGRSACLHVRRTKNGKPSVHPSRGDELRMFTTLHKENPDSGYVFNTERGTPFTADAINRLVKIIGTRAEPPFPVHFHMLRHSCGYSLANAGADTRARTGWPPLDRAPTALHRAISQSVHGFLAEPDWGVTMNKNNPPWSYIIPCARHRSAFGVCSLFDSRSQLAVRHGSGCGHFMDGCGVDRISLMETQTRQKGTLKSLEPVTRAQSGSVQ
jgi:hypothetical protein